MSSKQSTALKPVPETTNTPMRFVSADNYPPEIEARRADYERLADALCTLIELDGSNSRATLDPIHGWLLFERHLWNGIAAHFDTLSEALDWFNMATIRQFYVEMRLQIDNTRMQHDQAEQQAADATEEAK